MKWLSKKKKKKKKKRRRRRRRFKKHSVRTMDRDKLLNNVSVNNEEHIIYIYSGYRNCCQKKKSRVTPEATPEACERYTSLLYTCMPNNMKSAHSFPDFDRSFWRWWRCLFFQDRCTWAIFRWKHGKNYLPFPQHIKQSMCVSWPGVVGGGGWGWVHV